VQPVRLAPLRLAHPLRPPHRPQPRLAPPPVAQRLRVLALALAYPVRQPSPHSRQPSLWPCRGPTLA
jgi:hypothetical protein